jgi:hypothetical protein
LLITFASDRGYCLVDIGQRWLDGNRAVGREGKIENSHKHHPLDLALA